MISTARVSLGAVAPTALLVEDAAAAIVGTTLDDAAMEKLAAAASAACNPIDDKRGTIKFRTHVAGVLARRTASPVRSDQSLDKRERRRQGVVTAWGGGPRRSAWRN